VHRAWLNDPTLEVFNFDGIHMPLAHMEPRIAPKLMKALAHNTRIKELHLNNSNLQRPQGLELAQSLLRNSSLEVLGIENNNLDSHGIMEITDAVRFAPHSALQQLRMNGQKCCGNHFGRPAEEAIGELMEANTNILKLGVTLNDPHWRRVVDMCLTRNNDHARRQRKLAMGRKTVKIFEPTPAREMSCSKVLLDEPVDKAVWEVFEDDDARLNVVRKNVARLGKLPVKEQLQNFARSEGQPLKFSEVAPLLKDFRTRLLNAHIEHKVTVTDIYSTEYSGTLSAWSESNENWVLDVWQSEQVRFAFKCDKLPVFELSADVVDWIKLST